MEVVEKVDHMWLGSERRLKSTVEESSPFRFGVILAENGTTTATVVDGGKVGAVAVGALTALEALAIGQLDEVLGPSGPSVEVRNKDTVEVG